MEDQDMNGSMKQVFGVYGAARGLPDNRILLIDDIKYFLTHELWRRVMMQIM